MYDYSLSTPADLKNQVSHMPDVILSFLCVDKMLQIIIFFWRFATSCGGLIIFSSVSETSVACNDCGSLFQEGAHLACVLICNESHFCGVVHPK